MEVACGHIFLIEYILFWKQQIGYLLNTGLSFYIGKTNVRREAYQICICEFILVLPLGMHKIDRDRKTDRDRATNCRSVQTETYAGRSAVR